MTAAELEATSDSETTTVVTADISITKTGPIIGIYSAENPVPITYELTVENRGDATARDVTLVDPLPVDPIRPGILGVTYVSAGPTSGSCTGVGSCTPDASSVSCSLGTIGPNESCLVTLQVLPLASIQGRTIENTASVTSLDDPDGETSDPWLTTIGLTGLPPEPESDLSLTKTAPSTIDPGQQMTYTLMVTNAGPATASEVTVTDNLPSGVSFVAASSSPECSLIDAATVECGAGILGNGEDATPDSATFQIVVTVSDTAAGSSLVNSASCNSNETQPNPCTATATTMVTSDADLTVAKVGPSNHESPAENPQAITYTITVTNQGPAPAEDVTLVDVLPVDPFSDLPGVVFVEALPVGVCNPGGDDVICSLGTVAAGEEVQVTLVVLPLQLIQGRTIRNHVEVSSPNDSNTTNNSADFDTTLTPDPESNLSLTKTGPETIDPGLLLTYELDVTNAGPTTATNVTVTDTLPSGVSFEAGSSSPECTLIDSSTVVCNAGTLVPVDGVTFQIGVGVSDSVVGGSELVNTATCEASEFQPQPCTATATTMVTGVVDLAITKSDSADPVTAGQLLTYTLTVSNAGPSTASDVEVSDTLPVGVVFQSAGGTGWGCAEDGGIVSCTRASLAVGPAPAITIIVTAPAEATTLRHLFIINYTVQ